MSPKKTMRLQLKALLDETETAQFKALKEKYGVEANTETIRIILKKEYDRTIGPELPKEGAPQ